jgi:hypothetical protein
MAEEEARPPIDRSSFSKAEICIRNGISMSSLSKLDRLGRGPRYMRVGGLMRVSLEEERAWQRRLQDDGPSAEARQRAVAKAKHAGRLSAASPNHVSKRKRKTKPQRAAA